MMISSSAGSQGQIQPLYPPEKVHMCLVVQGVGVDGGGMSGAEQEKGLHSGMGGISGSSMFCILIPTPSLDSLTQVAWIFTSFITGTDLSSPIEQVGFYMG